MASLWGLYTTSPPLPETCTFSKSSLSVLWSACTQASCLYEGLKTSSGKEREGTRRRSDRSHGEGKGNQKGGKASRC